MSDRVLLLTDAATDRHASRGHVERPERRAAVAAGVHDAAGRALEVRRAVEIDVATVAAIHPASHMAALAGLEARGGGWIDADTYVVPGSLAAARLAAGATIAAAEAVADARAEVSFAVMRPPGHHASASRASGFCLLNNVALAAASLRSSGRASRIAILDWDVHHGDGTQAIFETDPDLLYASTHQAPLYPGTGAPWERGSGAAEDTKLNRPLPPGSGDDAFIAAWRDELIPAVEAFRPEAILVSAGYDGHRADPLAHLELSEAGFESVARLVGALAERLGIGGVALSLEGGYDLDALRASAAATVRGLLAGLREPGAA